MRRLYLSHAWRRATWGMGQASVPSRFLLEIPAELMIGPDLTTGGAGLDVDLDLAFGARGTTRFGRPLGGAGRPASQPAYRETIGRPGAPGPGDTFRPSRDLAARREAFDGGAPSGSLGRPGAGAGARPAAGATGAGPVRPPRPIVPGERQYRDGDRVRHARWGDGIVVTSKLTRSDEEITVAFKDPAVGRKTMLASLANLDVVG
jgi:DNA helicase-2/ATP-dependent DNA helicase PcrA